MADARNDIQRFLANAASHPLCPLPDALSPERGEAIVRACRGVMQVIAARADGEQVRLRRQPPAADYEAIRIRLQTEWRLTRHG